MSPREEAPDVDRLARSMLLLHGAHDDDAHEPNERWRRILVQGTGFRRRPGCSITGGHPA